MDRFPQLVVGAVVLVFDEVGRADEVGWDMMLSE
jgi:hypothetical protein